MKYFIFISNIGMAQSQWTLGTHIGVNSSDIAFSNRNKDWSLELNATTMQYGMLLKYQFNQHWAFRLEVNREVRGWNQPCRTFTYKDSVFTQISSTVDFNYYFLTVPLMIDYAMRPKKTFYASLGIVPMYQTKGTKIIRATGGEWLYVLYQPSRMNGVTQLGGLVNLGYRYPIREKIDIYAESRFNLSFNYYEGWRRGYHYAYGAIIGIMIDFNFTGSSFQKRMTL